MRTHMLAAAVLAAAAPATAAAAGFPAPGMDTTTTGATTPGDAYRYTAIPHGGSTLVAKVLRAGGTIVAHRELNGARVVAAAALDGATTGLSPDGSRLVLIDPRRARRQRVTHLVVIDTATLRPLQRLTLRGDFTLDAVAPRARRLFLVRFPDALDNPLDYAVRVYDTTRRRLLARPLVDPRNPSEKMTGMPLTRAVGPDARWAYTLYAGGEEQFVHALDTAGSRAFCIDLPGLSGDLAGTLRLVARGGAVDLVNQNGDTVRRIDTRTLRVSTPRAAEAPARDPAPAGGGFPWALAGAVAAIGAGALLVLRRRYAAGSDSAASRSASSSSSSVP